MRNKSQLGFSLMEMVIVVIIIAIIVAIAIPSLLKSQQAAKETATIANLRSISAAESLYYATVANNSAYGTFTDLSGNSYLDPSFTGASVTRSGYTLALSVAASPPGYCVRATPPSGGMRHFGMSQTRLIYQSTAAADINCAAGVLTTGGTAVIAQ